MACREDWQEFYDSELIFQIAEILQVNPKELINTPDE